MKQYSINKKYQQFNDFLRGELLRKKISQEKVARWLNLSQQSVSKRLLGETEWTVREIMSLYELMEIEHEWTEKKEVRLCTSRTSQIKDV